MDKFLIGDRIAIIETYYTSGCSTERTLQQLQSELEVEAKDNLDEDTINFFVKKFQETGSVLEDIASNETTATNRKDHFTIPERIEILTTYFRNGSSVVKTQRQLRKFFALKNEPSGKTINRLVSKFKESGTLANTVVRIRQTPKRCQENIEAIRKSIEDYPNLSLRQRSMQFGLSYTTLRRILLVDLQVKKSKITDEKQSADDIDLDS